jgi:hypothetical protein
VKLGDFQGHYLQLAYMSGASNKMMRDVGIEKPGLCSALSLKRKKFLATY